MELLSGTIRQDPSAPSPGQILEATDLDLRTPEFPVASISGKFTDPRHAQIGVYIILVQGAQFGGSAALFVYDINNNEIAFQVAQAPVGQRAMYIEIFSPANNIAQFKVSGGDPFFGIDNLTFDDLTAPQFPDFRLQYFGDGMRLIPGHTPYLGDVNGLFEQSAWIKVIRLNGSNGPLGLTVTNLPMGVSEYNLRPNPVSGPPDDLILLQLEADIHAVPIQNRNVTLNATPGSPSAGAVTRSISIPVTVLDAYQIAVVGIEITQGIQVYDLPGYDLGNAGAFRTRIHYLLGSPVVGLAEGGKTIVRVFANILKKPQNTGVPPMDCQLYGYSDTSGLLPGSPLSPENNFSPQPGANFVEDKVRADAGQGFYFTLPPSWTKGNLNLQAWVNLTPSFFPPETGIVDQPVLFELGDIQFTPTREVHIAPFALRIYNPYDGGLYDPSAILEEARNLLPIGEHQFFCPDYAGTVDITDIYNQSDKACGFLGLGSCPEDSTGRGVSAAARLRDFADDMNYT
jgi:hypothetical protein